MPQRTTRYAISILGTLAALTMYAALDPAAACSDATAADGTTLRCGSRRAQFTPSVDRAIQTLRAAAGDAKKVDAICTMLKDLDALAAKPMDPKDLTATERATAAILAKLPADLKSAVEAEFDLPEKDRGNSAHPYYQALDAVAGKCPG